MRTSALVLTLLFILVACKRVPNESITESAKFDHVTGVKAEDAAMLRAFAKARGTLDNFLTLATTGDPRITAPSLKVKIEDSGAVEYFWVADFSQTDKGFSGRIDNDPESVHNVKLGQVITFPKSQIYDWTYVDSTTGRSIGNFTACALLTHESPKDAAEFKNVYHLDCDT